jgi:hypothetical protein
LKRTPSCLVAFLVSLLCVACGQPDAADDQDSSDVITEENTLSAEDAAALDAAGTLETTVDLSVDCENTTGAAKQEAIGQGLCPAPNSSRSSASPQGTVRGNCGTATFTITDTFRDLPGTCDMHYSVRSSRGPIVLISWSVVWVNMLRRNVLGAFHGRNFPFKTTWGGVRNVRTQSGLVRAGLAGNVVTAKGYACKIGLPRDSALVR